MNIERARTIGAQPSSDTPLIVWLGPFPGVAESQAGQPWVGPAGQILADERRPKDCYLGEARAWNAHNILTNISNVFTAGKPNKRELDVFVPGLLAELAEYAKLPASKRVIVCLGTEPARVIFEKFFGMKGVTLSSALTKQLVTTPCGWTIITTYNPAHLLVSPNLADPAATHMALLDLFLRDKLPVRSKPDIRKLRYPTPADPKVGTVDIETYGIVLQFEDGTPAPSQKETKTNGRFHPAKSRYFDKPKRTIISVSITIPTRDPRRSGSSWDRNALMALEPGETFTIRMHKPNEVACLLAWLRHFDTIINHNLLFDIPYLTDFRMDFKTVLKPFSKTLIDTTILNYQHSEVRPEKSLKDLGPILGLYFYEAGTTARDTRFATPDHPDLLRYNAEDTHNTMLLASSLAALIDRDYQDTDKLSTFCIDFYSDLLWCCSEMQLTGITYSSDKLIELSRSLYARADELSKEAKTNHGLILQGKGSDGSKRDFLDKIISAYPDMRASPLLQITEKKSVLSTSYLNVRLARQFVKDPDTLRALDIWFEFSKISKMIQSYAAPMLGAKRAHIYKFSDPTSDRSAKLLPTKKTDPLPPSPDADASELDALLSLVPKSPLLYAYPSIYPVPSNTSDTDDEVGGTEQVRIVFRKPGVQTQPPPFKATITARRPGWGCFSDDLSQIELRTGGLLSGEPSLLAAYHAGHDLHARRAEFLWTRDRILAEFPELATVPIDKWRKANEKFGSVQGQVGKMVNFADFFLSSPLTMQTQIFKKSGLLVPFDILQKAVVGRPKLRPVLTAWQQDLIRQAEAHGYLSLPWTGVTRKFLGLAEVHITKIVNFPIQSFAALTLIDIQRRLMRHPLHGRIFFVTHQIYDAVYGEYLKSEQEHVRAIYEETVRWVEQEGVWGRMQGRLSRTVPLSHDFHAEAA